VQNLHDGFVAAMWSFKVSWSSKITLAEHDGIIADGSSWMVKLYRNCAAQLEWLGKQEALSLLS